MTHELCGYAVMFLGKIFRIVGFLSDFASHLRMIYVVQAGSKASIKSTRSPMDWGSRASWRSQAANMAKD